MSLTKVAYSMVDGLVPNVKNFGATGNGIADDSVAIQSAMDAMEVVYFPTGTYLIKTELVLNDNQTLIGEVGSIIKVGADSINCIVGTGKSNCTVRGLTLQGNNTGGDTDGNGMYFNSMTNTLIENNTLHNFGDVYGCGIYFHDGNSEIRILNNYVDGGGTGGGAVDINVYMSNEYAIVEGNQCYSVGSHGIGLTSASSNGKIICTNNISNNHFRHGILLAYTTGADLGQYLDIIVSNNITIDNGWSGLYYTSVGISGGTVIMDGNIIDSCGGATPAGLTSGGILITGYGTTTHPIIVSNNYVYNTGRTRAGVARGVAVSAVMLNGVDNVLITGNVLDHSTDCGVYYYLQAGGAVIKGNTFYNNAEAIRVSVPSGSIQVYTVEISDNTSKNDLVDGAGLSLYIGLSVKKLLVYNNNFEGKKAGTSKNGLWVYGTIDSGAIENNTWSNWDTGLKTVDAATSNLFGTTVNFRNNNFYNNTLALDFYSGSSPFIENTKFIGNTADGSASAILALTTTPHKVFYGTAAPVSGTWAVSDRVIKSVPTVGQPKAWVCTVAGTPGTWVSEGNL